MASAPRSSRAECTPDCAWDGAHIHRRARLVRRRVRDVAQDHVQLRAHGQRARELTLHARSTACAEHCMREALHARATRVRVWRGGAQTAMQSEKEKLRWSFERERRRQHDAHASPHFRQHFPSAHSTSVPGSLNWSRNRSEPFRNMFPFPFRSLISRRRRPRPLAFPVPFPFRSLFPEKARAQKPACKFAESSALRAPPSQAKLFTITRTSQLQTSTVILPPRPALEEEVDGDVESMRSVAVTGGSTAGDHTP